MATSDLQQFRNLLTREQHILIALPRHPSTDAIASGLALTTYLQGLGKRVRVVADGYQLPANHHFLPKSEELESSIQSLQKFVITLDTSNTSADDLSYDTKENKLHIYITPRNGFFRPQDVTTSGGGYEYGLVITLDAPSLESLGPLFDNNAEFFYHTPIINIDHRAGNTHFGQVNIIDTTATSTSEVLFGFFETTPDALNEFIATNLLAGIISKTKSFQTASVTPRSLSVASYLVASGARRDEIIRHLYQTKSITTLRLWGSALASLQSRHEGRVLWSSITATAGNTPPTPDELGGVIDELIVNTPRAEVIALFYVDGDVVRAIVHTIQTLNGFALFHSFQPEGAKDFTHLTFPTRTIGHAESLFLKELETHY